jgi:hypothetical protein
LTFGFASSFGFAASASQQEVRVDDRFIGYTHLR